MAGNRVHAHYPQLEAAMHRATDISADVQPHHLRGLAHERALLHVPSCALNVQPLNEATVRGLCLNVRCRRVSGDLGIQGRLVKRPSVLPAGSLHESGGVRLRDGKTREPDHLGLTRLNPLGILSLPAQVKHNPRAEHLIRSRRQLAPHIRQLSIEHIVAQAVELTRHGDLSHERLLERCERFAHPRVELLPSLKLLHQYHKHWRETVRLELLA
eukprot:scaffold118511_cov28-Tisochrysis_lutea.AAC.5